MAEGSLRIGFVLIRHQSRERCVLSPRQRISHNQKIGITFRATLPDRLSMNAQLSWAQIVTKKSS
jgi:hypothetical protein